MTGSSRLNHTDYAVPTAPDHDGRKKIKGGIKRCKRNHRDRAAVLRNLDVGVGVGVGVPASSSLLCRAPSSLVRGVLFFFFSLLFLSSFFWLPQLSALPSARVTGTPGGRSKRRAWKSRVASGVDDGEGEELPIGDARELAGVGGRGASAGCLSVSV